MRADGRRSQVVDGVINLLEEPPLRDYFFSKLRDPAWLRPLQDKGFFDHPPPPVYEGSEDRIRFPIWPESQYLANVAAAEPETVLHIIQSMPHTGNVRVYEDLAEAALVMPPHLAATLVPRAKMWLGSPHQLILPTRLGNLMAYLAEGGQVDAALDLAKALLALRPKPHIAGRGSSLRHPEPEARFDTWSYQEILEGPVHTLVAAGRERAIELLCDILADAVRISRLDSGAGVATDRYDDLLYIQRPAVEDHSQNQSHGLMDSLISAVRDAADQLSDGTAKTIRHLVQILERRRWQIFERLTLYLLWRYPAADPDLVSARLTDRGRFEEGGLRHEYTLLAKRCFATLAGTDKQKILGWIEEGPDLEHYISRYSERNDRAPSDEEVERFANLWRRDRLALFVDGLPERWRHLYEQLIDQFGPPEHPDFVSYITPLWVGPTSPQTVDDLRSMSVEEIAQDLASWQPSGEFMEPSPEGLGRQLTAVIAEDPERFAALSGQFQGLHPTYVRAYFHGLRDAATQGRPFPWSPVLNLCHWVLQQPLEMPGHHADNWEQFGDLDYDPDWGETRKTIGGLLSQGFQDNNAQIPFGLRAGAWSVLRMLTEDRYPTPEADTRDAESGMDPATFSLNTIRGQAMHATVRYALWVRDNLKDTMSEQDLVDRGFSAMPEVREVLDRLLDPEEEPSLAVRAVYGMWFPQLALIDETWAAQRTSWIFPTDARYRRLRDSAWEAYIAFSQPYTAVFRMLRSQYEFAVEELDPAFSEESSPGNPEERLAEHLMVFYWWGVLDIAVPTGLLSRFYMNSPMSLRRHALEFVARSLSNTKEDVPPTVLQRLRVLWLHSLEHARESVLPGTYAHELAAFGWWFISNKFDDHWAIVQLKQALELAGGIDPTESVLERLASVAEAMPLKAVECLHLIVEGDTEGWPIRASLEEVRAILGGALQGRDHAARQLAESLVNELGARGFWELGDLLAGATADP